MKDTIETMPTQRAEAEENFANRKLIRPALSRVDGNHGPNHNLSYNLSPTHNHMQIVDRNDRHDKNDRRDRNDRPDRVSDRGDRSGGQGGGRKNTPPEQTNAENFYYQKQMQSKTPMVIVLRDGEEVHGIIDWYDKSCIKIIRENGRPNLMIYKPAIKYMFKQEENGR